MLERRWGLQAAEGSFPPMSQEGRPQAASQVLACTDSVLGASVHALLCLSEQRSASGHEALGQ